MIGIATLFVSNLAAMPAAEVNASWTSGAHCGRELAAERLFSAKASGRAPKPLDTWADTDLLSNDLDIEAVYATQNISGSNTMKIKSLVANLSEFTFRLADTFSISSVTLDGRPITFTRLDPINVRANFDIPAGLNQEVTLQITYGGPATAGGGFGSIVFTTQNSQQLIYTLSEPFYSYTWWPSKDDNDDKALNKIAVTVPNTMKVAANGLLQGVDAVAGNKLKYRYSCSYPMTDYLLFFSATNYTDWTLQYNYGTGLMPVRFMIYPASDTTANRTAWENSLNMLTVFENRYGAYPFRNDQYGIYQFNYGGGMEHQTFTGQGTFSESVTAHELGHQWWGDMVTCRTWHDIWLNEGFATYSEAVWLQYRPGSTGWPALTSAMSSRKPTAWTGTVYRTDISSTNTIFSSNYAYRKGGWVLHMLRRILGETKFWNVLAEWRNRFQYASATTADFIDTAEDVAGQDLNWFFDPWVFQIGGVRYGVGSTTVTSNGRTYLVLKVNQTQSSTYPKFRMPVDLRFTDGSGTRNMVIWNPAAASAWYVIPITGSASGITLDPDGWILTTGTQQASTFTAGPPKIVEIYPQPGPGSEQVMEQFRVTFHTPVNCTVNDFELRTSTNQIIPISFSYSSATNTAIITPNAEVDDPQLTLTVKDTITAVNSGMALDGEVAGPSYSLPTGDGLAGGPAVFRFAF